MLPQESRLSICLSCCRSKLVRSLLNRCGYIYTCLLTCYGLVSAFPLNSRVLIVTGLLANCTWHTALAHDILLLSIVLTSQ